MPVQHEPNPNFVTGRDGLVVVDNGENRFLFLDPRTYEIIDVLDDFAPCIHELGISPDRRRALCAVYGDGYHGSNPHPGHLLAVVDLRTRRHVGDFSTVPYPAPHGVRWGAHGELYCNCEAGGVILEMDGKTGAHVAAIDVASQNAHRFEVLPDGSKLYTENEEDASASVVDLRTRELIKTIPTPNGLAGIGVSRDGTRVVLVDDVEPRLLLVDTAVDEIVGTVRLEGHDKGAQIARYSPNGRHCVVTSYPAPLATVFRGDLSVGRNLRVGKGPMNIAFHADGRTVLIANQDEGTLSVVDMERAEVLGTVDVGGGPETLSFF